MSVATRCARAFVRQRDGQAAAAGADVGDRQRRVAIGQQLERGLDDQLGLGPGNQHGRRDLERETPELLAAGDVGERFARRPPGDELVVARRRNGPAPARWRP